MSELITLEHIDHRPGETVAVGVGRDEEMHLVTFGMDWRLARDLERATVVDEIKPLIVQVEDWQVLSRSEMPVIRVGDPCPACDGARVDVDGYGKCGDCEGEGVVLPSKTPLASSPIDEHPPF